MTDCSLISLLVVTEKSVVRGLGPDTGPSMLVSGPNHAPR